MRRHISIAFLAVVTLAGCDRDASSSSPFGASAPAPLLAPFQGKWQVNEAKTLGLWQAAGATTQEMAQTKTIAKQFGLHPDMLIQNDVAVLDGPIPGVEGEYKFFALHPHGAVICGKAWHHEDRHDPGDMDKYLMRLELRDGQLYLSQRAHEDAADPNDPDVTTMPQTASSAATCTADTEKGPPWSAWRTYVFDRKK